MNVKLGRMFAGTVPVVGCAILAVVLAVFTASGAYAQDVFSSSANPATSGNSGKTGTQGVNGNPFCPPPVIIVNGVRTTPRNWSCRGDAQSYQTTPHAPPAVTRPGPACWWCRLDEHGASLAMGIAAGTNCIQDRARFGPGI